MRARRDWTRIEHELRGALVVCSTAPADATVRDLATLLRGDTSMALRVWVLRHAADATVLAWWREGRLSLAQLWACIGYVPACGNDGTAQRDEAAAASADVRRVLSEH